ncbi:hypothetical protein CEXT_241401 [Caerostris extrusa]|uniref:Uncharacterized protein n=1 Tax=Caerostris extrusa TaxID=172846 RepID=A0AAV4TNA7_CAEEX|nr:hypothetical protein CEXT_241401 [Caerostris extrusa]
MQSQSALGRIGLSDATDLTFHFLDHQPKPFFAEDSSASTIPLPNRLLISFEPLQLTWCDIHQPAAIQRFLFLSEPWVGVASGVDDEMDVDVTSDLLAEGTRRKRLRSDLSCIKEKRALGLRGRKFRVHSHLH